MIKPPVLRTAYPPEECRFLPETETSHILGGSRHMVVPIDLDKYDYIEEEYLIKGFANIYHWTDNERYPHILYSNAPYCSRMIVRKPRDPKKFSGIVHCEIMNPNTGFDKSNTGWAPNHEYMMSRGHGSISFTGSSRSMYGLHTFDPERYGEIAFDNPIPEDQRMPAVMGLDHQPIDERSENGLQFDFYSSVAALIKSGREDSPFKGYEVTKMSMQGTTGGDLSAYVAAVHPVTKLPDGKPCYDGFLIFMTGAPGYLNNSKGMLDPFDYRDLYYSEVPFIHLNTVADMLADTIHPSWSTMWHRYQPNEEGRYLRLIEIAGSGISRNYTAQFNNCKEDVERAGGIWSATPGALDGTGGGMIPRPDLPAPERRPAPASNEPQPELFEFPTQFIVAAMIDNLIKWMTTGEAPEKVDWLKMKGEYPDMTFDRDKYGVFQGGVRSPYVDCPLVSTNSSGFIIRRLSDDELRELYSSRADYVAKVTASVESMIAHGHLLPENAQYIIDEAKAAKLPFDD